MFENPALRNVELFAKGRRSLIYVGYCKDKRVAIKTARPERGLSNITSNEIMWLKKLNKFGVGPKLIRYEKDYFVYEFVEGERFLDWFKTAKKEDTIWVLKEIFKQLRIMDKLKVDKKEMHNPIKHILISNKVVMIDFERCHKVKRPKNITQFCQFLMSYRIYCKMWKKDKKELIDLLKGYKKDQSEKNFQKILSFLF